MGCLTKKKGEKFIKLEEFYPIYSDVKKSKETGNFEDFIECLKLYDKMENGTMMLGELEHILLSLGEKLEREEVVILIKECCDPEDDDGFIPYEPFLRRVCAGPTPRCTRIGKLTNFHQLDQQQVRATQQLSVKSTFNYSWLYQQLHQPEDKTINIKTRCGPKSPHANFQILLCFNIQVGFLTHILPSICHHQHICNIINLQTHFFPFLTPNCGSMW